MATNQIALLAQAPDLDPLIPAQRQAQLRALAFQQEQQDLQRDQLRQAQADDAATRAAFRANPSDPGARLRALAGASPKAYAAEAKSQSDLAKAGAETSIKQLEAAKQRAELAGQAFGFVRDNPTLENAMFALQGLGQSGIYTPEQVAQYSDLIQKDPSKIKNLATQAFAAATATKDQIAKLEKSNIGGSTVTQAYSPVSGELRTIGTLQNTQSPESIAAQETARRGQNMASATAAADRASRERLSTQANAAPTYDAERGLVVDRRSGTARQVLDAQGQPLQSNKPMTEFQGKSAGFADRALEADRILADLKYSPAAINAKSSVESTPLIGGLLGAATNVALSADDQRAEQAQRNFVNAVLRQESGAAIGASEFDNARKQYFPQPGDTPEQIEQKAENRRTTIAGLQRSAGPSYKAPTGRKTAGKAPSATNSKGWVLHVDANGNQAYVSPDGAQFEEVK